MGNRSFNINREVYIDDEEEDELAYCASKLRTSSGNHQLTSSHKGSFRTKFIEKFVVSRTKFLCISI